MIRIYERKRSPTGRKNGKIESFVGKWLTYPLQPTIGKVKEGIGESYTTGRKVTHLGGTGRPDTTGCLEKNRSGTYDAVSEKLRGANRGGRRTSKRKRMEKHRMKCTKRDAKRRMGLRGINPLCEGGEKKRRGLKIRLSASYQARATQRTLSLR